MKIQGRMNTNHMKTTRNINSKTSSIITTGIPPHEHDTKNSYIEIYGIKKSNSVRIMIIYS